MNIIKKIFNHLKAECIWAKMGFYTRFVYYHRKPLLVYKLTNFGKDFSLKIPKRTIIFVHIVL